MPRLSTSIDIKASPETVFQILRDVENYPRHFRYVRRATVIGETDNVLDAAIDEDIHGLTQHLQTRFRFFPPYCLEAEQIKGPFKIARATFQLEPIASGTRLKHTVEFEIGKGLVGKLIHHFIADAYAQERMAEEVVAIKRAAEALNIAN
jgi:ribosome-associated toxin RatA of RatAB toxin-antitoxin module